MERTRCGEARIARTIQHLERLDSYGVTFHSYTEPHLCADNEMVRGVLLAVLATMAKQEAKRLSERVIAGMRKAQAKGTKSGRLLKGGTGINKTAATVGVGTATVQRVRAEMGPFVQSAAA